MPRATAWGSVALRIQFDLVSRISTLPLQLRKFERCGRQRLPPCSNTRIMPLLESSPTVVPPYAFKQFAAGLVQLLDDYYAHDANWVRRSWRIERMAENRRRHVLEGFKVLDFTQFVAGPTVSKLMAEMGAEVIKVEFAPDGD